MAEPPRRVPSRAASPEVRSAQVHLSHGLAGATGVLAPRALLPGPGPRACSSQLMLAWRCAVHQRHVQTLKMPYQEI